MFEHQVEQKTSGPTVAVDEGVNALEFAVQSRQLGRNVLSGDPGRPDRRAEGVDDFRPALDLGRDVALGGWGHTAREGVDVVPPEGARPVVGTGVQVRGHLPHLGHRHMMRVRHLRNGEEGVPYPVAGFNGLGVHPAGGLAVPEHLEVA